MKLLLILAVVGAVGLADSSVTVLTSSELTQDLIGNPGYYIYERPDGLFVVEDLQNATAENPPLLSIADDVTFYIFTPQNDNTGIQITSNQLHQVVELTGFDDSKGTLVIIFGSNNEFQSYVFEFIINAALETNNLNVILVDWSAITSTNYIYAQASVLPVGNFVGDFLLKLNNELNHGLQQVTIVGHSLGAHVAGNAGSRTNGLIDSIVGLDPAGPLFTKKNTDNRLDPSDASYVHVIHTNDGMHGWGIKMGHADYFPNGGKRQPECGTDLVGTCAHSRAHQYYAESLINNKFVSLSCRSYNAFKTKNCDGNTVSLMGGFYILKSPVGNYYLETNDAPPYAKGWENVPYEK